MQAAWESDAPQLVSQCDPTSPRFILNDAAMVGLVRDLRDEVAAAALGGPAHIRERHTARGNLLPREHMDALLDLGSPLLELSALAAYGLYGNDEPRRRASSPESES